MPVSSPVTTIAELLALPDDGMQHELLNGVHVVTPSPTPNHERVVNAVGNVLRNVIGDHAEFEVFSGKADIRLGPRTLVQPDIFVIRNPSSGPIRDWAETPTPLLAVEILSPSTAARDRGSKRKLYLDAGIEEYWIVDLDAHLIERWRQSDTRPEIIDEILIWESTPEVRGQIDVQEIFRVVREGE